MKQNGRLAGLLVLAASAMALVACGGTGSSSSSGSGEVEFTYLNFKPEVADAYKTVADAYKTATGNTVNIQTAAEGQYETTLSGMMGKSNEPALFQINGPVGYNNWKDYCADMTDTDVYKHLSDKGLAVKGSDGKVYGVPYIVEGYGIIYNKKLLNTYFASSKKTTTYTKVADINSFTALKAVADDIQTTAMKTELGVDGAFASTSLASGNQWRWQTHLFNMPLAGEEGGLPTTVPSTFKFTYSANYKNIFDLYLTDSTVSAKENLTKKVDDSMAEMNEGKAVFAQNGSWATSQITKDSTHVTTEDIAFLPIYCGDMGTAVKEANQGICIGTENFLSINKDVSAAQQKAAKAFLSWLYTGSGTKYVTDTLAFNAPFDTITSTPTDPLVKETVSWLKKTGVSNVPWSFSVIPSETWKNKFGAGLVDYINADRSDASWTKVVSDASANWASEYNAANA